MQPELKPHLTAEEYLALERQAETKSEYWNGQVYALAGASHEHTIVAANTISLLVTQLRERPCTVHGSDMRVKVQEAGLYTYPDIVVVCGRAQFEDTRRDTLLSPTVLIEVLSRSTEGYDRGAKFQAYRTLGSLSDYLLIAQDQPVIEHYGRQPDDRWLLSAYQGLDAIVQVASIGCSLPLTDVFDKVEFPEVEEWPGVIRRVKDGQIEYRRS